VTRRPDPKLSDALAKGLFFSTVLVAAWGWGVYSVLNQVFPYPQIRDAIRESRTAVSFLREQAGFDLPLYYLPGASHETSVRTHKPEALSPGFVLVSHMIANAEEVVRIIDNDGRVMHEWKIDWFRLWPNPDHLSDEVRPKSRPGTSIHGLALMDDGDLVFNFENLGLLRLDYCGNVVWRLPYLTHHSVEVAEDGNLWVSGKIAHLEPVERMPNFAPPFDEYTVLEVAPTGKIVREISLYDLIVDNGLRGLLHLSTRNNYGTRVSGDTLHLNDVEPFPAGMEAGVFGPGDIMVSLRNINAVIVFDGRTQRIKYTSIGAFLRQHDPDFVDGNTISVFDNNNLSAATTEAFDADPALTSRILLIDARTGEVRVHYEGTPAQPFFTNIMGKHQWEPNGNVLITGAREGRAFAVDPAGELVWEYYNDVGDGLVGLFDDAQRLPAAIGAEDLDRFARACAAPRS
jgi:hypothetical protein